jgi:hypothetical protein
VSETTSQGQAVTGGSEDLGTATKPSRRGRSRGVVVGSLVILVAGGVAAAWYAGAFRSDRPSSGNTGAPPPATWTVARENIAETTQVNATLGYAASYTVTGKGSGTLTWLPSQGQVIQQGQVLYRVDNGTPVVLLYGSTTDWRNMKEGTLGEDVTQLNHDLVNLGYANITDISALGWDYYSWETNAAVEALEEHLGVSNPSGSLPLGSVVFEPEALRVTHLTGTQGNPAAGPILTATSDRHVVTIDLSTSMESEVAAGDAVSVTLPNESTTPGVITSVGTVASGTGTSATIPVYVRLTHPTVTGTLDQAPVTVNITTSSATNVLVVETTALLAQPSGGYEVEVVDANNTRRYVPVTVGIFDDADGLVQVSGNLTPGERVVVPST